jgi:hypothetical protein
VRLTRKIKAIFIGLNPELNIRVEELCSYFNSIGMHVERSQDARDDFSGMRRINLENSNINAVEYHKLVQAGDFCNSASYGYRFVYFVEREIGNERKDLEANTKKIRKSIFKKPVDFMWVGGRIADTLNQDTALKKSLYDEAGVTNPKEFDEVRGITRYAGIYIKPGDGIVEIYGPHTQWDTEDPNPPISIFPPLQTIEAYDKIAKYIHEQVHY